jgi:hypothetical protein
LKNVGQWPVTVIIMLKPIHKPDKYFVADSLIKTI